MLGRQHDGEFTDAGYGRCRSPTCRKVDQDRQRARVDRDYYRDLNLEDVDLRRGRGRKSSRAKAAGGPEDGGPEETGDGDDADERMWSHAERISPTGINGEYVLG
jgi:hypothetical protein